MPAPPPQIEQLQQHPIAPSKAHLRRILAPPPHRTRDQGVVLFVHVAAGLEGGEVGVDVGVGQGGGEESTLGAATGAQAWGGS